MSPPSLAAIRASNAAFFRSSFSPFPPSSSPLSSPSLNSTTIPTAIFVGGTSGIGEGMAVVFAQHTEGKSNIILVGRNRAAAERILASLPSPPPSPPTPSEIDPPKPAREFIQCDVTLMKNVHRASSQILARHPKITYLVLTPGFSSLSGRDETPEGIDKKLAVHY